MAENDYQNTPNNQGGYPQGYYPPKGNQQQYRPAYQQPFYPNGYQQQVYRPYPQNPPIINREALELEHKRKAQRKEIMRTGFFLGCAIMAYFIGQVIVSFILSIGNLREMYTSSVVFQTCFTAVGISLFSMSLPFFILSRVLKSNYQAPLIPTTPIKKKSTLAAWVMFGLGICFVGQILTAQVISIFKAFGYQLTQVETNDPKNLAECAIMLVCIAIVPAIFEEFSLRCCAMGAIRKYGAGFAVFLSSIVFGLMHMNVIQFVFAFTVGMILGYITIKTDSVVPAMLIHGFNNSISVLLDTLKLLLDEKTVSMSNSLISLVWLGVGILGLIMLVAKKEFKSVKSPKVPEDNSFFTKLVCVIPGLVVPFICMLLMTTQYIEKI